MENASFRHLSESQILDWAVAYRETTGRWPNTKSGPIPGTVCETWAGVNRALIKGLLGLPGGTTLARLLAEGCGARFESYMPPLSEEQILAWADAHHRQTGAWPTSGFGRVPNVPFERWSAINTALGKGCRGLPGGSSLAQLLAERRGARHRLGLTPLSEEQILGWADVFHQQNGKWPTEDSGLIPDSGGETWRAVDCALRSGKRGLPGGTSLPRLLAGARGVRNKTSLPELDVPTILGWADSHFQRTGDWPRVLSGSIPEAPAENWSLIDMALTRGTRGLPGGTTLARLLAAERGGRNHMDLPALKVKRILAWADAHFQRTGQWPKVDSGPIPEATADTWLRVETALRDRLRCLPGGSSLAQLLAQERGIRNDKNLPPLRVKEILAWAEAHRERTGRWPTITSGPIPEAPGETWSAVNTALQDGLRGQPAGRSLARLLARKRGKRHRQELPLLTVAQILRWADDHRQQTGKWPTHKSGPISGTAGETWRTVNGALRKGSRGLPGVSSLANLLAEYRGKPNRKFPPPLIPEIIRTWAEAHRQATGCWPNRKSGPILAAPGETWLAVDMALQKGVRGLPGGSSLPRLLAMESGSSAGVNQTNQVLDHDHGR